MSRHLLQRSDNESTEQEDREPVTQRTSATRQEIARQRFGGANPGAVFFGWLVAVGIAVLLAGILAGIAAAAGETADLTSGDLEGQAGDLGVGALMLLMVVLVVAYWCGGYVAGRMSRFDGAKQGLFVWLLGLVVTVVAGGLAALFEWQYEASDRIDLPSMPFSDGELTAAGVVAGVAVLVLTLIGAILGGAVGHRYHDRVDRMAGHIVEE
jgi:hypothetical protein